MTLYRARYWRKDNAARMPRILHGQIESSNALNLPAAPTLRGMTFSARNDAMATLFAYTTLQSYVDSIGGSTVWLEEA